MIRDLILFVIVPSILLGLAVVYLPMPIRDRYVLRKFATLFFISFVLEVALILIVRLGDKELQTIFDDTRPLREGLLLFVYHAPRRVLEVIPAAGILAAFFTMGSLIRSNELTALQAAGVNFYRMIFPIVLFTAACSVITLLFVDRIVAPATNRAYLLDRDRTYEVDREIVYREASGDFAFILSLDLPKQVARRLTFHELNGSEVKREIHAEYATWEEGVWHLRNGWVRTFEDGRVRFEPFKALDRPLGEDPRILIATASKPEAMTFAELRRVIEFKRRAGQPVRREVVRLHHNIAYPFALLVGVLLAFPLSMQFGRYAIAIGFPATMLISFIYWGLAIATFEAMGENGRIPPALAPWLANLLFGLVALALLRRVRR